MLRLPPVTFLERAISQFEVKRAEDRIIEHLKHFNPFSSGVKVLSDPQIEFAPKSRQENKLMEI